MQSAVHSAACLGQRLLPRQERPADRRIELRLVQLRKHTGSAGYTGLWFPATPSLHWRSKTQVKAAFGGGKQAALEGGLLAYPDPRHSAKLSPTHGHTGPTWGPEGWSRHGGKQGADQTPCLTPHTPKPCRSSQGWGSTHSSQKNQTDL